jgi:hypothetical protein
LKTSSRPYGRIFRIKKIKFSILSLGTLSIVRRKIRLRSSRRPSDSLNNGTRRLVESMSNWKDSSILRMGKAKLQKRWNYYCSRTAETNSSKLLTFKRKIGFKN